MGGQLDMRNLREHGIGQILHHQRHAVSFRPTRAEQRAGLGFASLERDAGPAQTPAQPDQLPVVRTLVHEERFAGTHAPDINLVSLQIVRKRLFDVENHAVNAGLLDHQPVQHVVNISRFRDGAVVIRGQPIHSLLDRDAPHGKQSLVIPLVVIATQLHLQTFQSIAPNPVRQERRIAIIRNGAVDFIF